MVQLSQQSAAMQVHSVIAARRAKADEVERLVRRHKYEALAMGADSSDDDDEDPDFRLEGYVRRKVPFVDRWWFNVLVGIFITSHAVVAGIEIDQEQGVAHTSFQLIDYLFRVIFFVELGLRLYYHRCEFFVQPGMWQWNLLDVFLVTLSLLDLFIMGNIDFDSGADVVTMIRFARLERMVRLFRVLRTVKELKLVTKGLLDSLMILFWLGAIVWTQCVLFGLATTLIVGQSDAFRNKYVDTAYPAEEYFGTVMRSALTFLQVLTLNDWFDGFVRPLMREEPWLALIFFAFVIIGTFGFLNVAIGVVVKNIIETAGKHRARDERRDKRVRAAVWRDLENIFRQADVDGSGTLTVEEVVEAVNQPEIHDKLTMIDVVVHDIAGLFSVLDVDDSGMLTVDEFIEGIGRIRGPARGKDLVVAQIAVDKTLEHYQAFKEESKLFREKLHDISEIVAGVTDRGERIFWNKREYRHRHNSLGNTDILSFEEPHNVSRGPKLGIHTSFSSK